MRRGPIRDPFRFKRDDRVMYTWPNGEQSDGIIMKTIRGVDFGGICEKYYEVKLVNYRKGFWFLTASEAQLMKIMEPNDILKAML